MSAHQGVFSMVNPDRKDSYTYDEMQDAIAREWARNEIQALKTNQIELHNKVVDSYGVITVELKALRDVVLAMPQTINKQILECRADFRSEVENDFPDKLEHLAMREHIEKQINTTDKELSKQISDVDKKIDATDTKLTAQITAMDTKLDKQWIKITVAISTVITVGYLMSWLLTTGKTIVN